LACRPIAVVREQIELAHSPVALAAALRDRGRHTLFFQGSDWLQGALLAVCPRVEIELPHAASESATRAALAGLARLVRRRRAAGGPAGTGVVALLSYELFDRTSTLSGARPPAMIVTSVDCSLRFSTPGRASWTSRERGRGDLERVRRLACGDAHGEPPAVARCDGRPRTSLPRERYVRSVQEVGRRIAAGEIYQANLCQRFQVDYRGDALALFESVSRRQDAPHAAFYETPRFSLISVSPEAFLRMRVPGTISTWPIKGTRPRGETAGADREAARELERSPKDRAELVMIVDLERNDLSRVCSAGTVQVVAPPQLRSFSSVHHLVAGVQGRLRDGVGIDELIRATFPGGSITGAPKIRAMQLLRQLEPVPRGYFTGCLCWFGDDGCFDSSILIRTLVLEGRTAYLGAGGGIVADSDAEEEWRESNHKARFLARALGFEPEEAS